MDTHSSTLDDKVRNDFEKLLGEAEKRVGRLRETYQQHGSQCMETRISIGEALVPLSILYEDAYRESSS